MNLIFINVNHDVGYESSESIPISLGYILAFVERQGSKGVILDDLQDRRLSLSDLESWIQKVKPGVIGFTAYQSTMERIRFLSRYIKLRHRDIIVALGGPQIVGMPSSALEHLFDVDILIHGEGELVFLEIIKSLENGTSLRNVAGLSYREDADIFHNGEGPVPPDDLDTYPSPYLSNILNLQGKDTAILLSSRGCKHVCLFCITPNVCKGRIRYHSVDRVVEEMELLSQSGIQRFWFADPNFTENKERTLKILEEKIKKKITTPFWFQTRSDLVDEELLKTLKMAGADTIAFGLESGSPEVLKKTKKGISLDRVRENITHAQSLGLNTELFTIFGLPGETVDNARATISFVKSLNIPVESNSGSQQMQLYFGSAYEKKYADYGFKPLGKWKPGYLSIGDQYETDRMNSAQIRKVRNLWALANEQLGHDVYYKQRVFEVLDFLLGTREDLINEPEYYVYGALASNAIEEFDLLKDFLVGYRNLTGDTDSLQELISGLIFFHETDEPSGPEDRIIFDSRSYMGGVPFTGISGKYWDVLLSRGLLLPAFEEGLFGVVAGQDVKFEFSFPMDYFQTELQGKTVEIHAKIHKLFKTFQPEKLEDVLELSMRNHYDFPDLDFLRTENEILYYLCLRDANPQILLRTPGHFLSLSHMLAKLGKLDQVSELANLLHGKIHALNAIADTLAGSGKYDLALKYYEAIGTAVPSSLLKRVRILLKLQRPAEAYELLKKAPQSSELDYQEAMFECLKQNAPDFPNLSVLENRVMNLKVLATIDREALPKPGRRYPKPIVHGSSHFDQ
ncbi:MAG: radical SAM protein [Deltaproteobacteria bacterium]|nr:radical SAM protein [Deltaproteobacteria bacterium]